MIKKMSLKNKFILLSIFISIFIACGKEDDELIKKEDDDDNLISYSTTDVTYSGLWIKDNSTDWFSFMNYSYDQFTYNNLNYPDYRIIDFEAVNVGNEIKYTVIFMNDGTPDSYCLRCSKDKYLNHVDSMKSYDRVPIDYEQHYENNNWYYSIIWASGKEGWATRPNYNKNSFLNEISQQESLGKYLVDVEIDYYGENFSGIFTSLPYNYLFFWELSYNDIISNISDAKSQGYFPHDIEIHQIDGQKKYSGLLGKPDIPIEWDFALSLSPSEFSAKNTLMQNSGYRPIDYEVHTTEEMVIGRKLSKKYQKRFGKIKNK